MPRTIYLAIFSNGPRPAHWAIFIPTLTLTPSQQHQQEHQQEQANLKRKGKIINVTGNPATGFFLEFCRGYDFDAMRAPNELVPLAEVDERFVSDASTVGGGGGGGCCTDTIARDRMESVATGVRPLGRSEDPFDVRAPNCQTWMEGYVRELIKCGIMPESAYGVLQSARRNFASRQER